MLDLRVIVLVHLPTLLHGHFNDFLIMYGLMNRPTLDHRYDQDHYASRANGAAHSAPGLALLPDEVLGWGEEHVDAT